jgi:hypothetical protein
MSVAGYRLELREPSNCYSDEPALPNFHRWPSRAPNQALTRTIVVEITRRIRGRGTLRGRTVHSTLR